MCRVKYIWHFLTSPYAMKVYKVLTIVGIIAILGLITSYIYVITTNIPVSSPYWPFNWNPPPSTKEIPLALAYPETFIISGPNGTLLIADMLLTFNGELAENTLVQVTNASCQLAPDAIHIDSVTVGFQGAFLPNMAASIRQGFTWGGGTPCAVFDRNQTSLPNTWSYLNIFWENNITFPVAGDYPPSIFITFDNGSLPIQYTYSQIRVHVLSASEVNAENTNRLNLSLTFAILAFSYIEGLWVIRELLKKQEKTSSLNK